MDQSVRLSVLLHRPMAEYRIAFLNHGDVVFHSAHFDAHDDEAAKEHAKSQHRSSGIGKGYQIWAGDRHVHTEVYR
jgi:hypothetical protein